MDDEYSEFNNEEYRMRNVRLRPQSGLTTAEDGKQSTLSRGEEGKGTEEVEANLDLMQSIDLNNQRANVKRRLAEYKEKLIQKKIAEEKAAKNR